MARRVAAAVVLTVALGGCGRVDPPDLPAACRESPARVSRALERAPAQVRLDGTKLSSCFTRSAEASDIQTVSATFLAVAERLGDRALTRPGSAEALRLGYLIGASEHGAAHTQGIHEEMVRRLRLEPGDLPRRSVQYRRGLRAGRDRG